MARRRKRDEDSGGSGYSWMDTYGDLVTLLLTFFVLLFSFSTMDAQKWETLVGALSGSSSISIPVLTPEMAMEKPIQVEMTTDDSTSREQSDSSGTVDYEAFMELYQRTQEYIEANNISVEVNADLNSFVITLRFQDSALFESGRATIIEQAQPIMDHVITLISQNDNLVRMVKIEGHTDNMPIRNAQFRDNWDLSISRASNVLRYFLDSGLINEAKISATGFGEHHPVSDNGTPEGRAVNRRVDFLIESVRAEE